MSAPIVMKFGGSSVADAARLRGVAALARERAAQGVLLVLSALSGVTDALISAGSLAVAGQEAEALAALGRILDRHGELGMELLGRSAPPELEQALADTRSELSAILKGAALLRNLPERNLDVLTGRGELLSTRLLALYMNAPWIDARSVLKTDSRYGKARPDLSATRRAAQEYILPLIQPGSIAITQGYIGSDPAGHPTTLGRGGSDYSASILGAALDAAEIQIWTDVEGVLSADPRIVPEAGPVEYLGYDEAAELAAFGAKVLHPATILPAVERGIPVTVRNSLLPNGRLTTIAKGASSGRQVTALASRGPVTIVTVRTPRMLGGSGFLARIFEVFGRRGISVDVVATSEVSVSATVDEGVSLDALVAELEGFAELRIARGRALIAIVGDRLADSPGIAGKAFSALGGINIDMISMGAREINLSFVVAQEDAAEAQRRLHRAFFPDAQAPKAGEPSAGSAAGNGAQGSSAAEPAS
jgi:aspartate kinase